MIRSNQLVRGDAAVCNDGDLVEFETLMRRTKRQAFNIAYRMTGNRDDAEDLTQEACLRAFRSFSTYNRKLPFEGWFFRILTNLFIDLMRRRPKQKPLSLDQPVGDEDSDDRMVLQIPDSLSDPERNLMDKVLDERLHRALLELPEMFRTAVLLCDVDGKSYDEIATLMNSSVGTVRSRIHRGRTILRKQLSDRGVEEGRERRSRRGVNTSLQPAAQAV